MSEWLKHHEEELADLDRRLDRLVMPSPLPILFVVGSKWPKIVYVTTKGKVYHIGRFIGPDGDVINWVEVRQHLLERIRRWLARR